MSNTPQRRRRKSKKAARREPIQQLMLGAGIAVGVLGLLSFLALHEQQVENAERLESPSPKVPALAAKPSRPKRSPAPLGLAPGRHEGKLPALKLGMAEAEVRSQLGAPDLSLSDHRFVYHRLDLDVAYRMQHGRWQLSTIRFNGSGLSGMPGFEDLPPISVGDSPLVLRRAFPGAHLVYHRDTGSFTLYDPRHHLIIDFTSDRITGIRMQEGFERSLHAALGAPSSFGIGFDTAFDSQALLPQMLTDSQITTRLQQVPNAKLLIHTVDMHLKIDNFSYDDLKEAIRRQVNMRVAAGDAAAALHVYAHNGSKIVDCDWYSPRYEQVSGQRPNRVGDVDENDIGYRWY